MASMNAACGPAMIAPPTGTIRFLQSVSDKSRF
jgi:hypothetical protein